jgi:putative (di)nucleoside polyphosphate hydrolase
MPPPLPHDAPHPGYRPCVGVALFNPAGLVFIGRRKGTPDREGSFAWQMPQGGLDADEDALSAARRELAEETGVTSVQLGMEAPIWLHYDLPHDARKASWAGRYKGQAQKWFAFRFMGTDSEIDVLAPPGGHKPEFDAWRWEKLAATPGLVVPFKRDVYETVAKLFAGFTR